ncbi:MAG: adenylate/guanylate cyclase domain-containing protein [Desulfobacterales bacterium]|nr:adenylate/guanylate cyclase domain-containing protein [Desulfobacterales bacterium]
MADKTIYLNPLVLLQTFEVYWAYYSVSDGKLYATACNKSASMLADSLLELSEKDERLFDIGWIQTEEEIDTEEILQTIKKWDNSNNVSPYENMFISIRKISPFIRLVKNFLIKEAGLTIEPVMQINREELMYREGVLRWQAHLPTMVILGMKSPEELLKKASESTTIVVVGDIKRLQELMTYAKNPESFSSFMVKFIEHTRMLVDEYMGVFDKFTGNGFLAYFNKSICEISNLDFVDCFANFVKAEIEFSNDLFNQWGKTLRKLPPEALGLSIGADIGELVFQDLASQLLVVGEPLVWAWRIAGMGKAGDAVVNNLLYRELENKPDIAIKQTVSTTASGEEFLTGSISFKK